MVLVVRGNDRGEIIVMNIRIDADKLGAAEDKSVMPEWQVRFIEEYNELKNRKMKLHKMLVKYDAGMLDFKPICPIELLKQQENTMNDYMRILEIRAQMEGVILD